MLLENFKVDSPNVTYDATHITANYQYDTTQIEQKGNTWNVVPKTIKYQFKTKTKVPKMG